MRYFKLSDDVAVPRRWHLGMIVTVGGGEADLLGGVACAETHLQTHFSHSGEEVDFSLTSFAVPVARSSLAAAIEAVGGRDVQRLPLYIPGHEGFEVVNALRVIKQWRSA